MLLNVMTELFRQSDEKEEQLNNYKPLLANSFLMKVLNGELLPDTANEHIRSFLGIRFPYRNYLCCCFELNEENAMDMVNIGVFGDSFIQDAKYHYISFNPRNKAIFINYENTGHIMEILYSLKYRIEQEAGTVINIGVGDSYQDACKISQSYTEAQTALMHWVMEESGAIIFYGKIKEEEGTFHYPTEMAVSLYNSLKAGNLKDSISVFDTLIERNTSHSMINTSVMRLLVSSVYTTITRIMEDCRIKNREIADFKEIEKIADVPLLKTYVFGLFKKICDEINETRENRRDSAKAAVIDWLGENFIDSNMSLLMAAEKFNASETYISRIVKEESGYNFVEFVNRRRIDKSKTLLKESEFSINQIAKIVGYSNDITYRRLFKKYEGITPGE
jgi:YesN/AraC family two-component response regulator